MKFTISHIWFKQHTLSVDIHNKEFNLDFEIGLHDYKTKDFAMKYRDLFHYFKYLAESETEVTPDIIANLFRDYKNNLKVENYIRNIISYER